MSSSKVVFGIEVKLMYPKLPIGLAQILQAFGDFLAGENVAILHGKERAQALDVRYCLVVLKVILAQAVLIAFFNRNGDVDGFARALH